MAHRVAVDLERDLMACAYIDFCALFVAHPLAALRAVQQKIEQHQRASEHALSPHDTDIKQPIIALGLPGIFNRASVELRVANNYLKSIGFYSVSIHMHGDMEAAIAQAEPGSDHPVA